MSWLKNTLYFLSKKRKISHQKSKVDSKWQIEPGGGLFKKAFWALCLSLPSGLYLAAYYEIINPVPKIRPHESYPIGDFIIPTSLKKPPKTDPAPIKKYDKPSGRLRGEGRDDVKNSVAVVKDLFSNKGSRQQLVDEILHKNTQDIEKVFDKLNKLEKLGNSRIGDVRKGKFHEDFNVGTGSGIRNGDRLVLDNGFDAGKHVVALEIKTKKVWDGSSREIDLGQGGNRRSSAEIMRTVRSHMPGIRHIYNRHLRQSPGFSGIIRVQFEISPSGKVVAVQKISSSTKNSKFDEAILAKIIHWKFSSISARGNDRVTIPLSFSE